MTVCHFSVGSTPTSGNAEDVLQSDLGYLMGHKTLTLTFDTLTGRENIRSESQYTKEGPCTRPYWSSERL